MILTLAHALTEASKRTSWLPRVAQCEGPLTTHCCPPQSAGVGEKRSFRLRTKLEGFGLQYMASSRLDALIRYDPSLGFRNVQNKYID